MQTIELQKAIERHLKYSLGKDHEHASVYDWRMSLSLAIRDLIVDPWFASTRKTYATHHKRVYYLSMEFLIGRLLEDAIVNLGLDVQAEAALKAFGIEYDTVIEDEPDAALGNGGLGRLAACFLESLSTIGCPAYGYGIRYEHGLFKQSFQDGAQFETAETWLAQRHAWEFERPEVAYAIGFGGEVHGGSITTWKPAELVVASGYDTPIIGWQGKWANTLRLWSAKPTKVFDLQAFNEGRYAAAAEPEALARTISRVLYPDDTTEQGKELRLKQEYFFTAASIQDVLRRYQFEGNGNFADLPKRVAIQLNDTHPAIAGPELVRLLHDEHSIEFEQAFEIARNCLSYTNHTLLPEALERWSEGLMNRVLPRHMQIIERLDTLHAKQYPARSPNVSMIERGEVKMGETAFISAHKVNGVSALHSELMKQTVFKELHELHPDRIVNQTNGVTPRRWLWSCNRPLSNLINETIGEGWVKDLELINELNDHVADREFQRAFMSAKRTNKEKLANWLGSVSDVQVDPDAMFDVQIKRIHEYKRQFMNILETIALWNEMRDAPNAEWTPRVKIFGGKAAPGYKVAKEIIHLINDVARTINSDSAVKGKLCVAYPANYNVSMAEKLIPAADLSEQISTAGKEASGTGNMKFAMNGAPTIGTLDGANVEIREHVGAENFFLFGLTADQVDGVRSNPDHARDAIAASPRLKQVLQQIGNGTFSPDDPGRYGNLLQLTENHDYFLVCSDFDTYFDKQREVDSTFRDRTAWAEMAAINTARVGWFSSDRTIRGYIHDVWQVDSALS